MAIDLQQVSAVDVEPGVLPKTIVFNPAYDGTLVARVVGIASGVPGFLGELGTMCWLLIKPPRVQRATVAAAHPAGSLSDL